MDDDFGEDADFTAAVEAAERSYAPTGASTASIAASTDTSAPTIQQPKPQALPNRAAPSAILVSPRQKGNPILNNIRSLPWEWSDIPSDFVLGNTTCALFLSLKYHRLHPEYIYSRIRAMAGKYNLRILLTMVDIQNHEESLKELSKTSLVNNLTLILCWSAQEAGRYLELYKSYEHASPTSIRAHQATSYSEKLVEFITVPRSINKTDAVGLVSAFGSVRAAVNARPEEIGIIAGWGEKKVQRWCETVRENFRVKKAARRGLALERADSSRGLAREDSLFEEDTEGTNTPARLGVGAAIPVGLVPSREVSSLGEQRAGATPDAERRGERRVAEDVPMWEPGEDEEEALLLAATEEEGRLATQENGSSNIAGSKKAITNEEELSEGVMTALAKLRDR
ncbi:RuvA domain 2-like [Lasallia pustulata]|uniref:RuvA domain 2-like n=1 Tax=Lasallia pustulata TaxID=136370 RepID=A0A1W5CX21_9LECA|nr:RuvA domain 2-like [Lasallia pustulata]